MPSSLQPAFEGAVPSANIPVAEQAQSVAPTGGAAVVSDATPTSSPIAVKGTRPVIAPVPTTLPIGGLHPPATLKGIDADGTPADEWDSKMGEGDMVLELADGLALSGHSFGANKSVAGECVFQTGSS